MKRRICKLSIVTIVALSLLMTSCIGKFALTNQLLDWNRTIGNKFLNEVVFVAFWLLPVYEITAAADMLVLNSIEFWSGTNPVRAERRTVECHGERYLVETDSVGYTITAETAQRSIRFDYNAESGKWTASDPDALNDLTLSY